MFPQDFSIHNFFSVLCPLRCQLSLHDLSQPSTYLFNKKRFTTFLLFSLIICFIRSGLYVSCYMVWCLVPFLRRKKDLEVLFAILWIWHDLRLILSPNDLVWRFLFLITRNLNFRHAFSLWIFCFQSITLGKNSLITSY